MLLRQRGCSLVIASPVYSGAIQNYLDAHAWEQGTNLFPIQAREFQQYTLAPVPAIGDVGLVLFRIQPRAGSLTADDQASPAGGL